MQQPDRNKYNLRSTVGDGYDTSPGKNILSAENINPDPDTDPRSEVHYSRDSEQAQHSRGGEQISEEVEPSYDNLDENYFACNKFTTYHSPAGSPNSLTKILDWDISSVSSVNITNGTYINQDSDSDSEILEMANEMFNMYSQIGKYVPSFNGKGDSRATNVEQFFRSLENATDIIAIKQEPLRADENADHATAQAQAINEERKRKICLLKLEGDALEYVQTLPTRTRENYELLKNAIKQRYSDGMTATDYNRELATITQNNKSVKELIADISRLVDKSIEHMQMEAGAAQNYKDTVSMNTMLRALNTDVLDRVMIYNPENWEDLQTAAIRAENALRTLRTSLNKSKKVLTMYDDSKPTPFLGPSINQVDRGQAQLCQAMSALTSKLESLNLASQQRAPDMNLRINQRGFGNRNFRANYPARTTNPWQPNRNWQNNYPHQKFAQNMRTPRPLGPMRRLSVDGNSFNAQPRMNINWQQNRNISRGSSFNARNQNRVRFANPRRNSVGSTNSSALAKPSSNLNA